MIKYIVKFRRVSYVHNRFMSSLSSEPSLQLEDIQGDVILGFNKPYQVQVVLDINSSEGSVSLTKKWLQSKVIPNITTTDKVFAVREERRASVTTSQTERRGGVTTSQTWFNISFGYSGLQTLLKNTKYIDLLDNYRQSSTSANSFKFGAYNGAKLLRDDISQWDFGKSKNNDILINIASDSYDDLINKKNSILSNTTEFLTVVDTINGFRGRKQDALYGHEHFGFLDGLSQPESKGTFKGKPVVKRSLSPDDPLFDKFSRPGFDLLDASNFLLQNTDKIFYSDLYQNGSFIALRKISQDVPSFWKFFLEVAKQANPKGSLEENKKLAGAIASKVVGRWWDGTPVTYDSPLTGQYYPTEKPSKKLSKDTINAFRFEYIEKDWKLNDGTVVKAAPSTYDGDALGNKCPFGAHIRKVNPRIQDSDQGERDDTLKHRIIRRAINYYTGPYDTSKPHFDRVSDVFNPTKEELARERGIAFLTYQSDIAKQFEFLLKSWVNSSTTPVGDGDDYVIGQGDPSTKSLSIGKIPGFPNAAPIELSTLHSSDGIPTRSFAVSKGMGYFLLPSLHALNNYISK